MLALRVAASCRSEFEWIEHAEYARAAAITDEEIESVAKPIDEGAWTDAEASLLRATDELTSGFDVSESTWNALAQHYDAPALVEMLFVVGQYTMLSMVANAAGLPA